MAAQSSLRVFWTSIQAVPSQLGAAWVVRQSRKYTDFDILKAANKQRTVPMNDPLIKAAKAVGTCFG